MEYSMNEILDRYISKSVDFVIAYDEIDFLGRLKPSAILQYFQDVVEAHAPDLCITHEQMQERGKFWVLSRLRVEVDFYPRVGSKITVLTYPMRSGLAEAQRSFLLYYDGKIFARAISKWCVLDIESRRICRCREIFDQPEERFCPVKALEFPAPSTTNTPATAVESDEKTTESDEKTTREFCVNISDLDRNMHMNNARYADVLLNMCSFEQLKANEIAAFDIRFMRELKHGDRYLVSKQDLNAQNNTHEGQKLTEIAGHFVSDESKSNLDSASDSEKDNLSKTTNEKIFKVFAAQILWKHSI